MWQPVLMISGYFISILGLAMLVPAAVDMYYTHATWSHFITSSIIAFFIGLLLFLSNRTKIEKISLQQGYLLTVISWFSVTLLSSLPFMLFGVTGNYTDAVFEAASGISTTGATIFNDVDNLPRAILFWRSLLNGLGGVGIVIFAVALLPFLGIGGMQIFHRESSDLNDKLMPKINYIAKRIIIVYVFLVTSCTLCLYFADLSWFDAVNHALSAVSTGGFSTKTASVGYYNSVSVELILIIFMISGSLPLTYYLMLLQRRDTPSFRSEQVAFFLKVLSFYILFTTVWLTATTDFTFWQSLRKVSFNVTAMTTDTGFSSEDYVLWGPFMQTAFIIFALTGGCTGSTSGAIKAFRWQVIFAFLKKAFVTATEPNRVFPIKIGPLNVENAIVSSVFVYVTAFALSIAGLTVLVALTGTDLTTAFSGVVACITSAGPGVGDVIGPSGSYASLTNFAKWVLSFAMLLGRLEVLTVIIVFTRSFWRN